MGQVTGKIFLVVFRYAVFDIKPTHTHTHNCFMVVLDSVWDYPGEQH